MPHSILNKNKKDMVCKKRGIFYSIIKHLITYLKKTGTKIFINTKAALTLQISSSGPHNKRKHIK
ncbi:hypothetical protein B6U70_01925 [Euryarchaeota archaeon ex4484_162]|nr:MAG: hypothetical protein B6U70_01925 [Euryarchaeota archaeon ex4484_162]RLF29250.1 MAG: hypothetical protein DRN05_02050 [Thermoplasmata archaeon]RLF33867.1 MAG: hypothetical protein DRN08_05135 [Thermoplasmata archaeon]